MGRPALSSPRVSRAMVLASARRQDALPRKSRRDAEPSSIPRPSATADLRTAHRLPSNLGFDPQKGATMHNQASRFALSRRRLLVTTAALGAGAIVGARSGGCQTKGKPSGQVVIGLSQEPTVFDPRLPHIEVDDGVYMSLFSPLWTVS